MIRALALCLLPLFCLSAAAQTPPEPKPLAEQKTSADTKSATPLCVYRSKNYSEGATVCVQKAMMQTCTLDGTKAIWVPVTDEKLSSRCQAPATRLSKYQRRAILSRRNIAREITPPTGSLPDCFTFNGRRYCE